MSSLQELSGGVINGFRYDDFFPHVSTTNGFKLEGQEPLVDHNYINFQAQDPLLDQNNHINDQHMPFGPTTNGNPASTPRTSPGSDSAEDSEIFSDAVLNYINEMLMEEDIDEKVSMYQEESALRAAEKPFSDILGQNYPPSPDQPPLDYNYSSESPDGSSNDHYEKFQVVDNIWSYDPAEYQQSQIYPVSVDYSSHSSFSSSNSVGNVVESLDIESQSAWQFRRGVEEARKFLPSDDKLVVDLEANGFSFSQEPKVESGGLVVNVKTEEDREYSINGSRGRKNPYSEDLDLDLEEGRSSKQSAVSIESSIRSEMFDSVLLCSEAACKKIVALRESLQKEASKNSQKSHSKGSSGGKARGKKQPKKDVVDLRTLLIHCAQAVAADDRRSANELLKQIRQHSSLFGDGSQRLAHCFANGLEARLAGTGSRIYQSLVAKRTSATDILKAYRLYLAACPFKKISHFYANQTILKVAEKATRLHIVDFGIYFGFQWPCLIQGLSNRPGGPPKLRITGIDVPQPGFRPTERIEETGRRLADYAQSFNVPFEYHPIASKWETIRVEDLKIDEDEVLVVNCLYRFKNLVDETVVVDSPRNKVLNTIRKMNPDVFIHGVVNGSYSAPFFVTRFREALFHYSALFDMLETNVPREDAQRLLLERDLFGQDALNVISCEGSERVERPETYKQWQVRNLRAGFEQLSLNSDLMQKGRDKVRGCYHKDFVIDEDSRWLLQGWKGRIIYALSTWRPNRPL